jgi:lysophospholipase L1-like esterase
VLLIGDSITYGVVGDDAGPSYAVSLEKRLGAAYRVTNLGCGGTRSFDWVPGADPVNCGDGKASLFGEVVVPKLPTDLAVVLLGTNDAHGYHAPFPTPVEWYRASLTALVTGLLEGGSGQVMLMTPPPAPPFALTQQHWIFRNLKAYRREVLEICDKTRGVICGPDLFRLLESHRDFDRENFHPRSAGHDRIASALFESITHSE